jgi:predicted HTH domain antitoxin
MTNEEIVKLILSESAQLQDVINKNFLGQFCKIHNINPKHNFLYAKQEVVAQRGFFPGPKKKYALWIINKEGVPVAEDEIKGLITRRSDYPRITKERIMNVIEILIKDEIVSFSKIAEIIENTRDEIRMLASQRSKQIGRPVSFSKNIDEYKAMPQHIAGMLFWNELEYGYFVPGTKGYLFFLRGINTMDAPNRIMEKLNSNRSKVPNSIVLPYEEESLPEYYDIDVEKTLDFCWNDRVNELVAPISKQIESVNRTCDSDNDEDLIISW